MNTAGAATTRHSCTAHGRPVSRISWSPLRSPRRTRHPLLPPSERRRRTPLAAACMTTPSKKRQTAGRRRVRAFRSLGLLTGGTAVCLPVQKRKPHCRRRLAPRPQWIALSNPMPNQGADRSQSVTRSWSPVRAADVAGADPRRHTPHTTRRGTTQTATTSSGPRACGATATATIFSTG